MTFNLLNCKDFRRIDIENIFYYCQNFHDTLKLGSHLGNPVLINIFYEPSTRTSLSFESAMNKLGGKTITFNKDISSLKKGESFEDTIKTLSLYGDILVIRHPEKGMVEKASKISNKTVINAGDGNGDHPTQALLDLYTIYDRFDGDYENKKILFIGDIKNSRTIHSLLDLLKLYPNIKTYLLAYCGLESDFEVENSTVLFRDQEIDFGQFDVIYVTRLQKERSDVERETDFIIDNKFLEKLKKDCIIMHPLPRNEEINPEIDSDKRAYYFKQMENGINLRKTLLYMILNGLLTYDWLNN